MLVRQQQQQQQHRASPSSMSTTLRMRLQQQQQEQAQQQRPQSQQTQLSQPLQQVQQIKKKIGMFPKTRITMTSSSHSPKVITTSSSHDNIIDIDVNGQQEELAFVVADNNDKELQEELELVAAVDKVVGNALLVQQDHLLRRRSNDNNSNKSNNRIVVARPGDYNYEMNHDIPITVVTVPTATSTRVTMNDKELEDELAFIASADKVVGNALLLQEYHNRRNNNKNKLMNDVDHRVVVGRTGNNYDIDDIPITVAVVPKNTTTTMAITKSIIPSKQTTNHLGVVTATSVAAGFIINDDRSSSTSSSYHSNHHFTNNIENNNYEQRDDPEEDDNDDNDDEYVIEEEVVDGHTKLRQDYPQKEDEKDDEHNNYNLYTSRSRCQSPLRSLPLPTSSSLPTSPSLPTSSQHCQSPFPNTSPPISSSNHHHYVNKIIDNTNIMNPPSSYFLSLLSSTSYHSSLSSKNSASSNSSSRRTRTVVVVEGQQEQQETLLQEERNDEGEGQDAEGLEAEGLVDVKKTEMEIVGEEDKEKDNEQFIGVVVKGEYEDDNGEHDDVDVDAEEDQNSDEIEVADCIILSSSSYHHHRDDSVRPLSAIEIEQLRKQHQQLALYLSLDDDIDDICDNLQERYNNNDNSNIDHHNHRHFRYDDNDDSNNDNVMLRKESSPIFHRHFRYDNDDNDDNHNTATTMLSKEGACSVFHYNDDDDNYDEGEEEIIFYEHHGDDEDDEDEDHAFVAEDNHIENNDNDEEEGEDVYNDDGEESDEEDEAVAVEANDDHGTLVNGHGSSNGNDCLGDNDDDDNSTCPTTVSNDQIVVRPSNLTIVPSHNDDDDDDDCSRGNNNDHDHEQKSGQQSPKYNYDNYDVTDIDQNSSQDHDDDAIHISQTSEQQDQEDVEAAAVVKNDNDDDKQNIINSIRKKKLISFVVLSPTIRNKNRHSNNKSNNSEIIPEPQNDINDNRQHISSTKKKYICSYYNHDGLCSPLYEVNHEKMSNSRIHQKQSQYYNNRRSVRSCHFDFHRDDDVMYNNKDRCVDNDDNECNNDNYKKNSIIINESHQQQENHDPEEEEGVEVMMMVGDNDNENDDHHQHHNDDNDDERPQLVLPIPYQNETILSGNDHYVDIDSHEGSRNMGSRHPRLSSSSGQRKHHQDDCATPIYEVNHNDDDQDVNILDHHPDNKMTSTTHSKMKMKNYNNKKKTKKKMGMMSMPIQWDERLTPRSLIRRKQNRILKRKISAGIRNNNIIEEQHEQEDNTATATSITSLQSSRCQYLCRNNKCDDTTEDIKKKKKNKGNCLVQRDLESMLLSSSSSSSSSEWSSYEASSSPSSTFSTSSSSSTISGMLSPICLVPRPHRHTTSQSRMLSEDEKEEYDEEMGVQIETIYHRSENVQNDDQQPNSNIIEDPIVSVSDDRCNSTTTTTNNKSARRITILTPMSTTRETIIICGQENDDDEKQTSKTKNDKRRAQKSQRRRQRRRQQQKLSPVRKMRKHHRYSDHPIEDMQEHHNRQEQYSPTMLSPSSITERQEYRARRGKSCSFNCNAADEMEDIFNGESSALTSLFTASNIVETTITNIISSSSSIKQEIEQQYNTRRRQQQQQRQTNLPSINALEPDADDNNIQNLRSIMNENKKHDSYPMQNSLLKRDDGGDTPYDECDLYSKESEQSKAIESHSHSGQDKQSDLNIVSGGSLIQVEKDIVLSKTNIFPSYYDDAKVQDQKSICAIQSHEVDGINAPADESLGIDEYYDDANNFHKSNRYKDNGRIGRYNALYDGYETEDDIIDWENQNIDDENDTAEQFTCSHAFLSCFQENQIAIQSTLGSLRSMSNAKSNKGGLDAHECTILDQETLDGACGSLQKWSEAACSIAHNVVASPVCATTSSLKSSASVLLTSCDPDPTGIYGISSCISSYLVNDDSFDQQYENLSDCNSSKVRSSRRKRGKMTWNDKQRRQQLQYQLKLYHLGHVWSKGDNQQLLFDQRKQVCHHYLFENVCSVMLSSQFNQKFQDLLYYNAAHNLCDITLHVELILKQLRGCEVESMMLLKSTPSVVLDKEDDDDITILSYQHGTDIQGGKVKLQQWQNERIDRFTVKDISGLGEEEQVRLPAPSLNSSRIIESSEKVCNALWNRCPFLSEFKAFLYSSSSVSSQIEFGAFGGHDSVNFPLRNHNKVTTYILRFVRQCHATKKQMVRIDAINEENINDDIVHCDIEFVYTTALRVEDNDLSVQETEKTTCLHSCLDEFSEKVEASSVNEKQDLLAANNFNCTYDATVDEKEEQSGQLEQSFDYSDIVDQLEQDYNQELDEYFNSKVHDSMNMTLPTKSSSSSPYVAVGGKEEQLSARGQSFDNSDAVNQLEQDNNQEEAEYRKSKNHLSTDAAITMKTSSSAPSYRMDYLMIRLNKWRYEKANNFATTFDDESDNDILPISPTSSIGSSRLQLLPPSPISSNLANIRVDDKRNRVVCSTTMLPFVTNLGNNGKGNAVALNLDEQQQLYLKDDELRALMQLTQHGNDASALFPAFSFSDSCSYPGTSSIPKSLGELEDNKFHDSAFARTSINERSLCSDTDDDDGLESELNALKILSNELRNEIEGATSCSIELTIPVHHYDSDVNIENDGLTTSKEDLDNASSISDSIFRNGSIYSVVSADNPFELETAELISKIMKAVNEALPPNKSTSSNDNIQVGKDFGSLIEYQQLIDRIPSDCCASLVDMEEHSELQKAVQKSSKAAKLFPKTNKITNSTKTLYQVVLQAATKTLNQSKLATVEEVDREEDNSEDGPSSVSSAICGRVAQRGPLEAGKQTFLTSQVTSSSLCSGANEKSVVSSSACHKDLPGCNAPVCYADRKRDRYLLRPGSERPTVVENMKSQFDECTSSEKEDTSGESLGDCVSESGSFPITQVPEGVEKQVIPIGAATAVLDQKFYSSDSSIRSGVMRKGILPYSTNPLLTSSFCSVSGSQAPLLKSSYDNIAAGNQHLKAEHNHLHSLFQDDEITNVCQRRVTFSDNVEEFVFLKDSPRPRSHNYYTFFSGSEFDDHQPDFFPSMDDIKSIVVELAEETSLMIRSISHAIDRSRMPSVDKSRDARRSSM